MEDGSNRDGVFVVNEMEAIDKTVAAVIRDTKDESDRGAVLVLASLVDDELERLCVALFVGHKKTVEELFSERGQLSSEHLQIRLLVGLGIVEHEIYDEFRDFKKIRHEFGHRAFSGAPDAPVRLTFYSETIKPLVDKLKLAESRGIAFTSPLEKYRITAVLLLVHFRFALRLRRVEEAKYWASRIQRTEDGEIVLAAQIHGGSPFPVFVKPELYVAPRVGADVDA